VRRALKGQSGPTLRVAATSSTTTPWCHRNSCRHFNYRASLPAPQISAAARYGIWKTDSTVNQPHGTTGGTSSALHPRCKPPTRHLEALGPLIGHIWRNKQQEHKRVLFFLFMYSSTPDQAQVVHLWPNHKSIPEHGLFWRINESVNTSPRPRVR